MDVPTRKKVENVLNKLSLKRLKIKSERELELTIWGLLSGRWNELLQFRKMYGGREADISLGEMPVEIKFIKNMKDKDRCVGQVLDYLNEANEVIVIAIDDKEYLKPSTLCKLENVSVIIV